MLRLNYDEIVEKIVSDKGVTKEEVESKIKVKIDELSDLISKEGAAHIIANQYGIKLFENNAPKDFKISDVPKGVNGLNILGKMVSDFEVREFKTAKRQGRLGVCTVGDETGTLRFVVWDDKTISELNEKVKAGDILKIHDAYSKDNNGFIEIHLGSRGQVAINPEGESIGEVKAEVSRLGFSKMNIVELKEGDRAEVQGTVVQMFEPRFYNACEKCGRKVMVQGTDFVCNTHGNVSSKKFPVVNFFFDDGTSNIRAVCFADVAEKFIGRSGGELGGYKPEELDVLLKGNLGKQFVIKGKASKNSNFDRLELMINSIEEADPSSIMKSMEDAV